MTEFRPAYLSLGVDEIRRRARAAVASLERCEVCPRNCRVNRLENRAKVCATGRWARVSTWFPHFGEEDCLRGTNGSGTIFFSSCNLKCVFCLPPDSLVATTSGLRRIADIFDESSNLKEHGNGHVGRARDVRVWTRLRTSTKVVKAYRRPFDGELVRLKPYSCPPIEVTPEHQMFAAHRSDLDSVRKIVASELTTDHFLVVPKRVPANREVLLDVSNTLRPAAPRFRKTRQRRADDEQLRTALASSAPSHVVAGQLGYHPTYVRNLRAKLRRGELAVPERAPIEVVEEEGLVRFSGETRPGIPRELRLDESLAWLLGIYCAEGHTTRARGRPNSARLLISFGRHERSLVDRTSKLLSDLFGCLVGVVERRTTVTVEVGKSSVVHLFKALCGNNAKDKRVPPQLSEAKPEVIRAFLDAYLAGDGTETPTHFAANTVSQSLAMGLFELGLHLGVLPSFHEWNPPKTKVIENRKVRQSTLYYVKFKKDRLDGRADASRERTKWKDQGDFFLVPLRRVDRRAYTGPVYDLQVEDEDHSYLAPFAALSNCQNHDTSQAGQGREMHPEELASTMLELQDRGCHNVDWVTPEHVVPQILEALPIAIERGLELPIVYNTSSYDSMESLAWMDGIVDIYMPDFKIWTKQSGIRYLKAKDYKDVACRIVREMHRQVGPLQIDPTTGLARRGLLVRHLVMPGLIDETREILRFLHDEVSPDTYVNVMDQYRPEYDAGKYAEIDRIVTQKEMEEARRAFRDVGLTRMDERSPRRLFVFL